MPSEGGYLEAEGLEKTWRIRQETISQEVDILSRRNQHDIILPGYSYSHCAFFVIPDTIFLETIIIIFVPFYLLVFLLLIVGP